MQLEVKVIPDTNVVVAASIAGNVGKMKIKHVFYDPSIQLFSLFRDSGMGFAMPKVRSECFHVLSKAVRSVYGEMDGPTPMPKREFYEALVALISSSEHKMQELLSRLRAVDLDGRKVLDSLRDVEHMSKELKAMYQDKYGSHSSRTQEASKRSKLVLVGTLWKPNQKKEAVHAHRGQVEREAKQLERFMKKHPNKSDQRILAETITFKKSFAGDDTHVLIASSDSGFFSPYYYHGGKSDIVTEQIYERFGIRCDHPRAVFRMAGGIL